MISRARGVAEGRAASAIIIAYAVEMDACAGLLVRWSDLVRRYTAREARNLLLGEVGRGITAANVRKGLGRRGGDHAVRPETAKDLIHGSSLPPGCSELFLHPPDELITLSSRPGR